MRELVGVQLPMTDTGTCAKDDLSRVREGLATAVERLTATGDAASVEHSLRELCALLDRYISASHPVDRPSGNLPLATAIPQGGPASSPSGLAI